MPSVPSSRLLSLVALATSILALGCEGAPLGFQEAIKPGAEIEAAYQERGGEEVDYLEFPAPDPMKKFEVHFPKRLRTSDEKFPVVVFVNGTGVRGSSYAPLFQHLASWGFVVLGNEDPATGTGKSSDETLAFILAENERPESVFFGKIDVENIGISGHSQGGVGVFNAITKNQHSEYYKTAVALSPACESIAYVLNAPYDPAKVAIPILIIAGDADPYEVKFVCPPEKLQSIYERIDAPKAKARKKGRWHAQMLYAANGYVVAWFMSRLKGDERASKAFEGDSPELLDNPLYIDQQIDLE